MSWELWQIVKFTFNFLFSVVFKTFFGLVSNLVSCFPSNRKRNVYQSWEISCQSDRPCAPENAPPPPIRTTAHLPFPLLWTIPNLSSRHQDTPSLLLTTTPIYLQAVRRNTWCDAEQVYKATTMDWFHRQILDWARIRPDILRDTPLFFSFFWK